MSYTYDPSKLSSSKLYQVRLNIGDTISTAMATLQDEEIQYFLDTNYQDVNTASIKSIDARISKASNLADSTTGQVQISLSQLIDNLTKLRYDFLTSASRNTPKYAQITGVDEDDREKVIGDDSVYQDGLNMVTEPTWAQLLNGPIDSGPSDP